MRSFDYDAAGNTTTDTRGGAAYNYVYNSSGRLVELDVGSTATAYYTYDGLKRLAIRTTQNMSPSNTTHYIYDHAGHLVAEADGSGNTLTEYVWLDDMPLAVVANIDSTSPNLYFVHADHLNRPLRMTDNTETTVWDAIYKPFGGIYSITGSASNNLRFPGQYFLIESGLNYNWFRHYDASLGRYTQPDPLEFVNGPNLYNYAMENPIALEDPSGLQTSLFCVAGGPANPACDIGVALDLAKMCIAATAVVTTASHSCPEIYRRYLQDRVNNLCKPFPKRCEAGESCAWMRSRITQFTLCAEARKTINDRCYGGGDSGHQFEYTRARQEAAICNGMVPSCTPP